jgi:hypothetical protein
LKRRASRILAGHYGFGDPGSRNAGMPEAGKTGIRENSLGGAAAFFFLSHG